MKKHITIKLTESQLYEAQQDAFEYLTNSDTIHNDGQKNVSVGGKLNDKENGSPITTDDFASMTTTQAYNRYGAIGNTYTRGLTETDNNKDGVDDFYNNDELDIMSNGDETDNLEGISNTVDTRTDNLVNLIKQLPPKKQAIVLNKILENMDLNGLSYNWKKELAKKLGLATIK